MKPLSEKEKRIIFLETCRKNTLDMYEKVQYEKELKELWVRIEIENNKDKTNFILWDN